MNRQSIQEYRTQIKQLASIPPITDKTDAYIFTIDPQNSLDYDDGFSIETLTQTTTEKPITRISIYIANVYVWIEAFGLWKSFSERVATIYLPDYRRPMLPTILSESLCSLQEKENRFAFVMEVDIDEDGTMEEPRFYNGEIRVSKNYAYEDKALLADKHYRMLYDTTTKLDENVMTSYDVVAYWMVRMNRECGRMLAKHKTGIYRANPLFLLQNNRSQTQTQSPTPTPTPQLTTDEKRILQHYKKENLNAKYVNYYEEDREEYTQITSPIRRLVDLLNYMTFIKTVQGCAMSQPAEHFIENWLAKMEYINTTMRMIRKVEMNCDLINKCTQNPELLKEEHVGLLFDKMEKKEGMYTYAVYVERLKLLTRITTRCNYENFTRRVFKMYIFEDEHSTRKKIRIG